MKGLFKLLSQYIFASESIFFILIMPLILLGIMGEALIFGTSNTGSAQKIIANSFIAGISATTIISSALFLIPITIVDFKNSVLMKRIGATNIKPYQFLLLVVALFVCQSTFSFFYTRTIATLFFGNRLGWDIAFKNNIFLGYAWVLFLMVLAISIGMVIASLAQTVRQVTAFSNIFYFPIAVLSGGLIPIQLAYSSKFLKNLSWANPYKYAIELYLRQEGAFKIYTLPSWADYGFPLIVVGIVILCSYIVSKKLKWSL